MSEVEVQQLIEAAKKAVKAMRTMRTEETGLIETPQGYETDFGLVVDEELVEDALSQLEDALVGLGIVVE